MKFSLSIIILSLLLISAMTRQAQAVPPPDFIFNIGSQVVQIFSFLALGFSILAGILKRFFQTSPFIVRHRKLFWLVVGIGIVALSYYGATVYSNYRQQRVYTEWVEESKQQDLTIPEETEEDGLDKLKIGELKPVAGPRGEETEDTNVKFIREYYRNLARGNIVAAYAVSSKIVPLEEYKEWYKDTTDITLDSIQKINASTYSLGLTLHERAGATRYAVLMRLRTGQNGQPEIERSDVRVLADITNLQGSMSRPSGDSVTVTGEFFEQNQHLKIAVGNDEFKQILATSVDVFVLDAREDEEFEIGQFPGSHHIRFADLKSGEWIVLPQDKVIYVFCWSGIRGKEVAEFLRSKKIVARYVGAGADGWVDSGGKWQGQLKFLSKYTEDRYQIVFNTDEVKNYAAGGVVLVDSRHPAKYKRSHIAGSVSIPVIYTPTSQMEQVFSQISAGSRVITICDDFVSCFDAKVTGVKLEKRGHTFLGRYNNPWDYK
jgi:rhodanese-related sulfurtransferase